MPHKLLQLLEHPGGGRDAGDAATWHDWGQTANSQVDFNTKKADLWLKLPRDCSPTQHSHDNNWVCQHSSSDVLNCPSLGLHHREPSPRLRRGVPLRPVLSHRALQHSSRPQCSPRWVVGGRLEGAHRRLESLPALSLRSPCGLCPWLGLVRRLLQREENFADKQMNV